MVLSSWLNPNDVFPLLSKTFVIRSVVATLNINSLFVSKNGTLAENVITFATTGYSQSIVVEARGEAEVLVGSIIRILRLFNKEARIVRTSNGILTSGQANDIIKDNLFETEYHRFLRGKYLFLYNFQSSSNLSLSYLVFRYPVV